MQLTNFFYIQAFFCPVFFFMFMRVRAAIGVIGFFLLLVLAAIVDVDIFFLFNTRLTTPAKPTLSFFAIGTR